MSMKPSGVQNIQWEHAALHLLNNKWLEEINHLNKSGEQRQHSALNKKKALLINSCESHRGKVTPAKRT